MGTLGALIWLAGEEAIRFQATHQFSDGLPPGADRTRPQSSFFHRTQVPENMHRSQVCKGLAVRVKILKEQSQFLGVELDCSLGVAFYAVAPEVIFEDFL